MRPQVASTLQQPEDGPVTHSRVRLGDCGRKSARLHGAGAAWQVNIGMNVLPCAMQTFCPTCIVNSMLPHAVKGCLTGMQVSRFQLLLHWCGCILLL